MSIILTKEEIENNNRTKHFHSVIEYFIFIQKTLKIAF
jgi:hypothetical protein